MRCGFSPGALVELECYTWPGNVRELRNVVERVLMLTPGNEVDAETIRLALPQAARLRLTAGAAVGVGARANRIEAFERETLLAELKRHNHHMTHTARVLGLERSHLYKKCQQLGIDLRAARAEDAES